MAYDIFRGVRIGRDWSRGTSVAGVLQEPRSPGSFLDSTGRFAVYSGVAVAGLTATRFVADIAARGLKTPLPLFGTLLGSWGLAVWLTTRGEGASRLGAAALIGSGIGVIDEGMTYFLPKAGFGPKKICEEQPAWGGFFPKPSLFRQTSRDACDPNFWRGRWVGREGSDGKIEKRWCHDAYFGDDCCPPKSKYTKMEDWPPVGGG